MHNNGMQPVTMFVPGGLDIKVSVRLCLGPTVEMRSTDCNSEQVNVIHFTSPDAARLDCHHKSI